MVFATLVAACSEEPEECPRGSHMDEGACVPDDAGGALDASAAIDAASGTDASSMEDAGGDDASIRDASSGTDAASGDAGSELEPDAGSPTTPPTYPARIDNLSFAIRTGGDAADASNGNYRLCLNDTRCFDLNVPDVNDFRRGDFDVYHFANVDLPRANVDRVELRHQSGDDAWRPVCVEVRFDGEPVHCQGGLDRFIGNGGGATEVARWRDPDGLHNACNTCYPSRVTHGPLVGAVGANDARVWVRTDATRPVRLNIARASAPGTVIQTVGPQYPRPQDDFTTVFDVSGLSPRTRYVATVQIGGTVTRKQAQFRTAPAAGAASAFRIALGSCSNNDTIRTPHPIFDVIAARSPDVFLFLGDNHYGNTGNRQAHWWNYRDVLAQPPRASFVSSTSILAIWDDHDFTGNNSTRHAPGRDAALRAFTDYWANPGYGTDAQRGVFFRHSYGDVDLFMLDTRYERDRPPASGAPPAGSIVGAAQHRWLERELMSSRATFKILASGSLFSNSGGETWREYASRRRLFDFIRDNDIRGVVLLAGDIHRSALRRIDSAPAYPLPEIIASGLANVNPSSCNPGPAEVTQVACHGNTQTFVTLDVDTTRADPRIIARIIAGDGDAHGSMTILRSQLR